MEGKKFKNIQEFCFARSLSKDDLLDMINAAAFSLCSIRVYSCEKEPTEEMEQVFVALSTLKDLLSDVE